MSNDFGFVHIPDESIAEQAPAKKSGSKVTERSIVKKEKVGNAVVSTDGNPAAALSVGQPLDTNRVSGLATAISNGLPLNVPDLGIGDLLNQYGKPLAELGLLGFAAKKMLGGGNPNAPVQPPEAKPDMRNFGQAPIAPVAPATPAAPKLSAQDQALIAASERNRIANEAAAAAKANPIPTGYTQGVPGSVSPMSQLTGQPTTPAPINAAPPAPPAPPAAPVDLVAAAQSGQDMSQPIKEDVAHMLQEANNKPIEKAVYPKGESLKSIPPGFVFREDVGNLDRSLGNILGKEHREYARELFNEGKPFGHSPNLNDDVSKLTNQYFQHLQSQVPETILGRDARRAQNIPSEFGTFAKNTNFGQKAKIGGVTGTLLALADLANASQPSAGNAVVPPKTSDGGAAFGGFTSGKKYQAAKKRAEQADVNTLADPKTYAAVQSFLGVPPDQLGFSVMHPEYQKIRDVADPAYAASILATLLPGLSKFGKK